MIQNLENSIIMSQNRESGQVTELQHCTSKISLRTIPVHYLLTNFWQNKLVMFLMFILTHYSKE